jgi:phospholipase C
VTDSPTESPTTKPWQAKISRRQFIGTGAALAGAAALAGYLPESLTNRATTASAAAATGTFDLSQIKHLVFLMQENRSFDHYFGTFPGVRGFSDPTALKLATGNSVFQQPDPANPDGYLEPYHISTVTTGAAAVPSLSHGWAPQHASWNNGAMDGWLRAHIASDSPAHGPYTMGYYTEEDVPFHWALAQAFSLLDNYHCSVLGPTDPNRAFWMNGTNDPQGTGGGPILETVTPPPLTFESGAETMFNAGLSLWLYSSSSGATGASTWQWFAKLKSRGMVPDALFNAVASTGTLFGDGTPGGVGNPANPTLATNAHLAFEEDCANGVLPDVAFLSTDASEHPPAIPAAGAQFIASKLEALAANDDLWNTTLFVLDYDENDGFFDHVPPPIPDQNEFPEEFVTKASVAGTPGEDLPVGAGFRVPCWVISPWTVGGKVFSAVSDHTSCLQLIEAVAAAGGLSGKGSVTFPFISRWRRATFSNLTGALVPGTPQPAPANAQFNPSTTAANLAAQRAASLLPLPPFPGRTQTTPLQLT